MQNILKNNEATEEVKLFFEKWKVYKKIVVNNYTGHEEVYAAIHDFIKINLDRNFSVLDLGSGDALYIAKALKKTKVKSYCGVDLSKISLDLAHKNLTHLNCDLEFFTNDFFDFLENSQKKYDLIFMGLSLHHLLLEQKQQFIIKLKQIINPNGFLIIFDTFLNENETREEYLVRWHNLCHNSWLKLTKEEKSAIETHVTEADYPESFSTFQKIGKIAGFTKIENLLQHVKGKYGLVIFHTKSFAK
ncbi:MAG: class I SAM-dependent methyltransferase [Candidatus Margulisiibacteriota bacterium]|jgi:SAM-dependent methyltransferase